MNDPIIQDVNPRDAANEFGQLLEQASRQQRALWEQAGRYSKDESLRFATLRLKRTNQALEGFQGQDGLKSLVSAQQAWLRDLLQDYAALSIRYGEMMGSITGRAMALAVDAGKQAMDEGHAALKEGQAAAEQNAEAMRDAGEKVMRARHDAMSGEIEPAAQPSQDYH